jgi:hypothetical protein
MPLTAQPAGVYAYTGTAQVAAACRIAGVAVDAVDGDTCIKLTARTEPIMPLPESTKKT